MQYWNEILPSVLKNQTSWSGKHRPPPLILQPSFDPDRSNKFGWPFEKFNRSPFTSKLSPPLHTTSEPIYAIIKRGPSDRDHIKEDMMGMKHDYGTVVTAAPSIDDQINISTAMNIVIIVGIFLLIGNLIVFAGLYYKRTRLKMEERNLKRQYEDMQNANLDIDIGGNPLREKAPLSGTAVLDTSPQGCNVMKMIRQSTKSEDTYEAVKASEGSSNQRFKLTRNISSSTLDPHTKVRDWIAQEIVQKCSPRFLRRTRQQFALEHKRKESIGKSTKGNHKNSSNNTNPIKTNSTSGPSPVRPVSPNCKNSSVSSTQKPKKVSVAIDATADARSSSVLKQEPIELSKSLESCSSPAPGRMRRSMTLEDFTMDEKPRPQLKRQNSVTDISSPKESFDEIITINHQYSKSEPVNIIIPRNVPLDSTPKLKTFDPNQDVNVTCKEELVDKNVLSPEEALLTIKRRNFPKVLPDFPTEPCYNNSMKRRSLPSHNLLSFSSFPENRSATMDHHSKIYSRIPPAPPPRISSTLGRKPSNVSPICEEMKPIKLIEESSSQQEPTITSNSLHVGPLIPTRIQMKKSDSNIKSIQPIYDNLKNESNENASTKNIAKTIISADCDHPVKRVEPRVIIKPNTNSLKRDPTKINKVIPRVVAKDNSVEDRIATISQNLPVPHNSQTTESSSSAIPTPPPMPYFIPSDQNTPTTDSDTVRSDNNSPDTSSDSSVSNSTSTSSDTGTVVKRQ